MEFLCTITQLYIYVIIGRILLSWFPVSGGVLEGIDTFLRMLTEPILGPMRRAIPPVRLGAMALDLSPMILILVIGLIVQPLVCTG